MSINLEHLRAFVVVAGLAGAGKSSVLDVLSDLGFYIVDNLPVELLEHFVRFTASNPERYALSAVLVDVDNAVDVTALCSLLKSSQVGACRHELIFVDCSTAHIIKRYNETRRPHPGFNPQRDKTLDDAILREREFLQQIKESASFVLDTTQLNIHELRREIKSFVDSRCDKRDRKVRVNFVSFGYKYGTPPDCDLIVDVRFIPNPYFVDNLREQSGLDQEVADFVLAHKEATEFLEKYKGLLDFLLPHYAHEGKSYLNIGVGCTGGRHRSVVVAEELLKRLDQRTYGASIKHRDLNRHTGFNRE